MGPYDPERFVPAGVHGMGDDREWDVVDDLAQEHADALADLIADAEHDAALDRRDRPRSRPAGHAPRWDRDVHPGEEYL